MEWFKNNWFKVGILLVGILVVTLYFQVAKVKERNNYFSKRHVECVNIYKFESEKWSNVNAFEYNSAKDKCTIEYLRNSTEERFYKDF